MMDNTKTSEKRPKVAIHTLGCRLNMSESGSIAQGFVDRGYEVTEFGNSADVVFINTCTVTDKADSTCRNLIRKAQKSSPEGTIVVAGCYAQMEPETIKRMKGVDLILGNSEKYKVFDYLNLADDQVVKVDQTNEFWGAATTPSDSHTRAFLKIQDGCNYICSFCIIPFARGRSRTIEVSDALNEARELVQKGFKEIVLTGVNIGEYESTSGKKLSDLLKQILEIDGLERLRLSSVEPNTISRELLEVMKSSPKFLDHFHIPLQSGDDKILTSMRRKYDVKQYRETIELIKEYFPDAGIGADIIVGYPGETPEQFENTYNLVKELPITHFHVFPFSRRQNTTAARLPDQIPHDEKKRRVRALTMFGDAKLDAFAHENLDRVSDVLFERKDDEGYFTGYTTNYLKVFVKSDADLSNKILPVKLTTVENGKLYGEIVH